MIHAQELFMVLEEIVKAVNDTGGTGFTIDPDLFECAELMVSDIKEYW
jgi:hypothetical protein